jgi:hypothetical protein
MMRKLFGTLAVAVLLCVSAVVADEIKGKITKVDVDGKKVTVSVDGKDTEYTVSDDCKMPKTKGKDGNEKTMTLKALNRAVEKSDGGVKATVNTEKKDGKETVTEIKIERRGKGGDK